MGWNLRGFPFYINQSGAESVKVLTWFDAVIADLLPSKFTASFTRPQVSDPYALE